MKDSTLPESKVLKILLEKILSGSHVVIQRNPGQDVWMTWEFKMFTDKKIYLIHYIKVGNQETYSNRDWYPILTSSIVSTLKVLYLQVGFDDIIIDRVSYSITR